LTKKNIPIIKYLPNKILVSLETCWLLGFTEAEGCFTISFLSNSTAFRTRFELSQKGVCHLPMFTRLAQLFKVGVISGHYHKDNYEFIISGLSNVSAIYGYFDKYIDHFKGIKKDSYLKFKALNARIANKEH